MPNNEATPVLGHYHYCDTLLLNDVMHWLAAIIVERLQAEDDNLIISLPKEFCWDLYTFHQQMETGYSHPRSDSRKFRVLRNSEKWRKINEERLKNHSNRQKA